MKIRIWGTSEECAAAQQYYRALGREPGVKSCTVSRRYLNRGSTNQYRVYVDIEYKSDVTPSMRALERL